MHKFPIKEFLEREVPEVDCERLKRRVLARILEHDQKHARGEDYYLPRVGVMILAFLVVINVYALIMEILVDRRLGELTAPGGAAHLADNIITLALLFSVGVLADKNFLGACRTFRAIRAKAVLARNFFVRLPALSVSFIRSLRRS